MEENKKYYNWHSGNFSRVEQEKIDKGNINGCPVCGCKDTGIKHIQGFCGSSDSFYFCQKCGVTRMGL